MRLAHEIDARVCDAAFGLILLEADETAEPDFRRLLPSPRFRVHHSRVRCIDEITPATLPGMAATIPAAADLLPRHAGLAAIGYGCTSGAAALGEETVARLVGNAWPGVPVSNPLTALKAAAAALGIRRLGMISPYIAEVSDTIRACIAEAGPAVTAFGSFERQDERTVARISTASILAALDEIGGRDCDAVFASCTNLRATEVLEEAERRIGKPVLTSNQVLAWHLMRLAGVDAALPGGGALAGCPLAGMG